VKIQGAVLPRFACPAPASGNLARKMRKKEGVSKMPLRDKPPLRITDPQDWVQISAILAPKSFLDNIGPSRILTGPFKPSTSEDLIRTRMVSHGGIHEEGNAIPL
jgi:hypothetical protein